MTLKKNEFWNKGNEILAKFKIVFNRKFNKCITLSIIIKKFTFNAQKRLNIIKLSIFILMNSLVIIYYLIRITKKNVY